MHYCRDMSIAEIAEELDLTERTIKEYLYSEPSQEVQEMVEWRSKQVRVMALEELRQQLKVAGEKSRSAEKPVKVWPEDGDIKITDIQDDAGNTVDRIPIPDDFDLLPDETARFFRREEVREIIEQMTELVGAKEPEQHELDVSGDLAEIIMENESE